MRSDDGRVTACADPPLRHCAKTRRATSPLCGEETAYFFPGGVVNGELPADTAGFGFSALGLRTSLLLLT